MSSLVNGTTKKNEGDIQKVERRITITLETVRMFPAEVRHVLGMTQEQLARELNVSWRTVARWESRKIIPPIGALEKLQKIVSHH